MTPALVSAPRSVLPLRHLPVLWAALLVAVLGGCAELPKNVQRPVSTALETTAGTALATQVQERRAAASGRFESGFLLLSGPQAAYGSRLALVEAAQKTLDLQYYAIHADASTERLLLGLLAAARRGWVEQLTLRLADFSLAFPALLTAILLSAVRGPGLGNAVLAIALLNIPIFARLARASAASVWAQNYVLAARACGKSRWRITWEHILPHCAGVLMAQASSQFALAILAEAALSYLGLGVQAPTPSWGRMLSEAQSLLYQAPQLALYPGLAIALAVLGFQLLGEGLRQLLAPPTQGRSPW